MHIYINEPTRQLIEGIQEQIAKNIDLSQNPKVLDAFAALQRACTQVNSFVEFIETYSAKPTFPDFSSEEITLIELYLLTRVLSTYAAIPLLVAQLNLNGELDAVSRINSNAIDEGGGKGFPSHHELLVNSLTIVAKSLKALSVSTKLLVSAIRITEVLQDSEKYCLDEEVLWDRLQNDTQYIPIERYELQSAISISRLLNENMLRYHRHIQNTLLQPVMHNPTNKRLLGVAALELAKREAESVNESDRKLSFIGSWEKLTRSYKSQIPDDYYTQANAWAKAHNDEEEAKLAGWHDKSAEDGHARDARIVAMHFLSKLNPMEFTSVLEQVTVNANLRLSHWNSLVAELNSMKHIHKNIDSLASLLK